MGVERLELSRFAAPEPKSGASTNSATLPFYYDSEKQYTFFLLNCQSLNLIEDLKIYSSSKV